MSNTSNQQIQASPSITASVGGTLTLVSTLLINKFITDPDIQSVAFSLSALTITFGSIYGSKILAERQEEKRQKTNKERFDKLIRDALIQLEEDLENESCEVAKAEIAKQIKQVKAKRRLAILTAIDGVSLSLYAESVPHPILREQDQPPQQASQPSN